MKIMSQHFPTCPICESTNGYGLSGVWSHHVKCLSCEARWKIKIKKNKILEMTLDEFPKDGKAVYTVVVDFKQNKMENNLPLFTLMGEKFGVTFWQNLKLNKNVNWDYLSENVYSIISGAVIKEDNEAFFHQWHGIKPVLNENQGYNKASECEEGFLLLSNQKLRWIVKRGFKDNSRFLVLQEIPLEDIRGVSGETGDIDDWALKKRVSIVDSTGEIVFYLYEAFLEVLKPLILEMVQSRKKEIKKEKKKERFLVALDFSFITKYMKKGGLTMQVLKCPECGGKIEFPESGNRVKCSYCGQTIYANDIFEKIKSFLE